MASSILLEQEYSMYESPKIDVIQITARDIVCTSDVSEEGGGQYDNNWGI